MTSRDDLDRSLTAWLAETAPTGEPEHLLGEVLARTARTRRRPAWRIPERWIPMSTISTSAAAASRVPWRTVGLAALLILALAVGAVVVIGSRRPAVPPPFGPAANGQLVFSVDGDIMVADGPSGTARTIIGGPTSDSGPWFAPDGTRFVFVRGDMASSEAQLWVADADGSHQTKLADAPYVGWIEWSPQADVVAMTLDGDLSAIQLVAADGSGSTSIDTGLAHAESPIWRPSDGRQMTFRGKDADGVWGIYLMDRDGSNLRRLDLDPGFAVDPFYDENRDYYFDGLTWSDDGSRLLFHTLEPDATSTAGAGFRIHVANVGPDGSVTGEQIRTFDPAADDEFGPVLLADGDTVVFQAKEGTVNRLMTGSLSGDGPGRDLGLVADDYWIPAVVSPDGRQLLSWLPSTKGGVPETLTTDLASGASTKVGLAAEDYNWQRTVEP